MDRSINFFCVSDNATAPQNPYSIFPYVFVFFSVSMTLWNMIHVNFSDPLKARLFFFEETLSPRRISCLPQKNSNLYRMRMELRAREGLSVLRISENRSGKTVERLLGKLRKDNDTIQKSLSYFLGISSIWLEYYIFRACSTSPWHIQWITPSGEG